MVLERLKYVTVRKNKNGKPRFYWQPKDRKALRLPDDPVERFRLATEWNASLEVTKSKTYKGSVSDVIDKYRHHKEYEKISGATKAAYEPWLKKFEKASGNRPFSQITRAYVVQALEQVPGKGSKQHLAAVFKKLFKQALYLGYIDRLDPILSLGLETSDKRDTYWMPEDINAWLKAAENHEDGPQLALCMQILLYTAQRPIDVVKKTITVPAPDGIGTVQEFNTPMAWSQYNGDTIQVRQKKTGKLLSVPCHANLRKALDTAERKSPVMVTDRNGKPMTYGMWSKRTKLICKAAGLTGLQTRDLRRTAVVNMAEAGCEIAEIASVTGHSLNTTTDVINRYLPQTERAARNAVVKWEQKG
jgi:integrase